jgi:26S proteasome regulatory subunit T6
MEMTDDQPLLSRVKSLVEPKHHKGLQPYYT